METTAQTIWGLGDYHRFAKATVWPVGAELVHACGIGAGQSVLDVAAGTGNVALRAAEAGASVVASDLEPANLAAGRRDARANGLELEWVEADAQALPFAGGRFDVVTSSFGAMFAPDHRAVAEELLRVCRPGGTIGIASFTPDSLAGGLFGLLANYAPADPPGTISPLLWGSAEHVRELFGDGVESLAMTRRSYVERAADPRAYCDLFWGTFGPAIAIRAALEPDRAAELDGAFLDFATRLNEGRPGGPAEYTYEYLLVVARRA